MTTTHQQEIGVIGMGVMGLSLARNFASHGFRTAIWDRSSQKAQAVAAQFSQANFYVCEDLASLVQSLERPRRIVLMILAGAPVDELLRALDPLLEPDDIVVDAGNSLYTDTDRRLLEVQQKCWRFVGMGVSGGEEGAVLGPAMMPGGDRHAWQRLRPLLVSIAAKGPQGPCVAHCGQGSAGHFVKMVHNGIEYGDMQLIAETATLLRSGLGLDPATIAATFAQWNQGELQSFLIEITADIFRVADPQQPNQLLLDAVADRAGQKGTGRWTVIAAAELGVAIPTIAAAVDARVLSAATTLRTQVAATLGDAAAYPNHFTQARTPTLEIDDLRDALYAAKIASYSQGFDLLAKASAAKGYGTNLAEVARIWTAGCIIRAAFLEQVSHAFADGQHQSLILAPYFSTGLSQRLPAWRRVVGAAMQAGIPVPGLAASLTWLDNLATARGSAALIQAQRDYFGAHTYERVDAPGVTQHSDWKDLAAKS